MSGIGSVDRSMAILELFIHGEYDISQTEVSKKLDISLSTAKRTLLALCKADILVEHIKGRKARYRLSVKVVDLARAYLSSVKLIDVAEPYLNELKDITRQTVAIFKLENNKSLCIAASHGNAGIQHIVSPGFKSAIHAGAPSKVLLAYLPDEKLEEILQAIKLVRYTKLTRTTANELKQDLVQIRKDGFSVTKGEETEHAFGVSVPIKNHLGEVIASMSITGFILSLTKKKEKEFIKLAKDTCAKISYDLGYVESAPTIISW